MNDTLNSAVANSQELSSDHLDKQHQHHDGKKSKKNKATTGVSAASVRAISSQVVAFYFRAPVKAFFRSRLDYMAFARAIHPQIQAGKGWSWRVSTPGLLIHAVQTYGWSFIPNQIVPPLFANVTVGAVLYTSYLHILGQLHEPSSHSLRKTYPPPAVHQTLAAGFCAGSLTSVIAAPLDALQIRFRTSEMLEGRYKNMWQYSFSKLQQIGIRGVFAGFSMSFCKDAASCALFFSTFEFVKAQLYMRSLPILYTMGDRQDRYDPTPIRPHYMIEPLFLLLGGAAATFAQQAVQFPISQIQNIHYAKLESLDYAASLERSQRRLMQIYYHAYLDTYNQARTMARRAGGWRIWLYKDFVWSTLRQTPSTSAGLIVFEIVRRKYGEDEGGILATLGAKQFIL